MGRRKPSIDLLGENGSLMRRTILVVLALASLSACDSGDPEPTADPTPTLSNSSTVAPATPAPRSETELCYSFTYDDAVVSDGATVGLSYGLPSQASTDWSTTLEVVQ